MNNNNDDTMNIQELNEAIHIELNRQDSVVKELSKKFGMTELVIRVDLILLLLKNYLFI
jgi:hypothetical protein